MQAVTLAEKQLVVSEQMAGSLEALTAEVKGVRQELCLTRAGDDEAKKKECE